MEHIVQQDLMKYIVEDHRIEFHLHMRACYNTQIDLVIKQPYNSKGKYDGGAISRQK